MPKVRVYQLAKDLKVQSALILELLDLMGQEVKSDLSSLDQNTAKTVRLKITSLIESEKKRLAEEKRLNKKRLAEEVKKRAKEEKVAAAATAEKPAGPPPTPPVEPITPPVPVAAAPADETPVERPQPRVFPARRVPVGPAKETKRVAPAPAAGRTGAPRPASPPAAGPEVPRAVPGRPARPHPGARPVPPPPGKTARRRKAKKAAAVPAPARPKPELPPVPDEISLSEAVTVKELAEKLNRKSRDVIAKLLTHGVLANINQPLDPDVAIKIAKDFGSDATILSFEEETQKSIEAESAAVDRPDELASRPPVVTVMGHVDHGKTSLLDSIRSTEVVAAEHGGITQHIGAYQVEKKGRKITFLDTPGHEAFTMMRARGAKATDIVVLVVAADDGVKPQTVEAIDHARAAEAPMVVAINKIDKPGAYPDRVKKQLADHDLLVEDFGGQTVSVNVSAKKGTGIDDLLEMILLVSDMQEFRANPNKPASGVVLEARLDRSRGIVATLLVQEGALKTGDPFIAGTAHGKVRAMSDEHGRRVEKAGPSTAVEVMGFSSEPAAGDVFQAVPDETRARQIASFRQEKARAAALRRTSRHVTLESLSREMAEGESTKELPILLKADVQGSIEALQKALGELPSDRIKVNILRASTGAVTQADVLLASASNAIVVGFNIRPDRVASDLAKQEEVEVRLYTVIYDLVKEIEQAMVGLLEPMLRETVLGLAEVRQLFKVPKVGTVAGCLVTEGKAVRNADVRLLRDNVVTYTGKVGSLRRFKEDVGEVKQGFECGIGIANYNDIKEGDVIEFFAVKEIAAQTL